MPLKLLDVTPLAAKFSLRKTLPMGIILLLLTTTLGVLIPSATAGSVWTRSNCVVAKAGDTLSFDITLSVYAGVQIDGWFGDVYTFMVTGLPSGWSAKFYLGNVEVTSLNIKLGETVTLKLNIATSPTTAPGDYYITFTAHSSLTSDLSLPLTVTIRPPERHVKISSAYPYLSKRVGEVLSYPVTISNNGEKDEILTLNATLPTGWNVNFLTADGKSIRGLRLEPNQSQQLTVEFNPPKLGKAGMLNFTVTATSEDGCVNATLNLRADIYESSVELKSATPQLSGLAGNVFSYPITLINYGADTTFKISAIKLPAGWQATFKLGDKQVQTIYLEKGSAISLIMELTTPLTATHGVYQIVVGASSDNESTSTELKLWATILPPERKISVSSSYTNISIQQGQTISIPITISNEGSCDEQVNLNVEAPEGWQTIFKLENTKVQGVYLKAGLSRTLNVELTTPSTTVGNYQIKIYMFSSDQAVNVIQTFWVTVQSPPVEIKLKPVPPYLDTYGGVEAQFKIQVLNTGGLDVLLNLAADGLPSDFRVTFKDSAGRQITAIYVEAGQSKEFYVSVSTPKGQELGVKRFRVSAFNDKLQEYVDLTLNVLGFYKIELTNQNFYISTSVGGENTYTLYVKNTGNMEVTNVKTAVTGSTPDGFIVSVSPDSIQSLKVNQEASFVITIQTETNVNAGNYYVNFQVMSDQTDPLPFTLRVEVFQTVNWILYAGIIFIVMITMLILIYRRFGRR
ncbi:MAG: NEW3 domain-containing protein [Candidatus Bathyarchaeota archaeon]